MKKNELLIVSLFCAINFTHILDFMIMMPLGNFLMPHFKISPQQFTILVGAYPVSAALSSFTGAFFVDKFDRKNVLLMGYCGFLLGTILCGFSTNFIFMFSARIVAGLLGGITYSQILAIVADVIPYERRGKAMGQLTSANAIASTLGVPFGLYLANNVSWQAPFILVGLVGIIVVPLLVKFLPSVNAHMSVQITQNNSKLNSLKNIVTNKKLRLTLVFSGLIMLGHYLIIPFITPYMEYNNGYSKNSTPLIYLVGGISSFVAGNFLGRQSDKVGKFRVFNLSVICSLPIIITITNLSTIPFWMVLSFFSIWYSSTTGRGVSANALVTSIIPAEQRGSFMSFNSCVQQLGTFTASILSGSIVKAGSGGRIENYPILGYLSVAILVVCLLLAKHLFAHLEQNRATLFSKKLAKIQL